MILSLVPPTVVLFVHLFRQTYWPELWTLDPVAHFCGGFAIAWMAKILLDGFRKRKDIPVETPQWFTDYVILASPVFAGVLWEFMEWGMDTFFGTMMQFTIPETMSDLLLDFLGGCLFLLILLVLRRVRRNK